MLYYYHTRIGINIAGNGKLQVNWINWSPCQHFQLNCRYKLVQLTALHWTVYYFAAQEYGVCGGIRYPLLKSTAMCPFSQHCTVLRGAVLRRPEFVCPVLYDMLGLVTA